MTSEKYQTAQVHWRIGQALLPEHFQAQESSLREELLLRLRLLPMPFWGVGSLEWELSGGVLGLRQLTLLLRDGTLVDIPGNTAPPGNLSLAHAGKNPTSVYLHLGESKPERVSQTGRPEEDEVERLVRHVTLSSSDRSESATVPFKLAEFHKKPTGDSWTLSESFLPPLLRVHGLPFFQSELRRLDLLVDKLRQVLQREIEVNHLANKSVLAARECRKALYRFEALLSNLKQDYQAHPFELFRALHELYIEVCMMRESAPDKKVELYKHEELAGCFRALMEELNRAVKSAVSDITYLPFVQEEGMQVCHLKSREKELREARRMYLMLQKPSPTTRLDLSGLKLASVPRLPEVRRFAMQGIPFRRVDKLPFHHPFSSEVEFYALKEGQEWDHASREGAVAFFQQPELEQVRAFLFWSDE